jgi:hypothetical protein
MVLLPACKGGLDDDSSGLDTSGTGPAATLALASDAAKVGAAIAGLIVPNGPISSGKALSLRPQGTTTTNCDSGSVTFTTDDSSAYAQDGRRVFEDCTVIFRQNNVETSRIIQDGVSVNHCAASASNNTICTNEIFAAGEDGVPLTLRGRSSTQDAVVKLLSDGTELRSGSTTIQTGSGITQSENLVSHKSMTLVSDDLAISTTLNSNGTMSATANGGLGLSDAARSTANCISGQLTVSTPVTLTLDTNENFNGGKLHFASPNGNVADVVFNADGSVTATINNGTPSTFSKATFAGFCSVN